MRQRIATARDPEPRFPQSWDSGQGDGALMEHDTITLYRGPILREWLETGEYLFRLVRNVLIQEIADHFGISTGEILRLEGQG